MMEISSFDDLLVAARLQPDPQRLLFVFAGAGLPDDSSPEQRASFAAGVGGELTPMMIVDKSPASLTTFAELSDEACQFGAEWSIAFVASLSGRNGSAPTEVETGRSLERMIEDVKRGTIGAFIPFDRDGHIVRFV